jgi:2'-5' RNA ligase superfamily
MRKLLVVSYPIISPSHFAWIQDLRKQYDEINFKVISPHFTLVFPVSNIKEEAFVQHVRQSMKSIQSFEFVIRCATIFNDAFRRYTHLFLVPDEGYSHIIKLHDQLYTGVLAKELRLDIAFIPHIGIANFHDASSCKQLADNINKQQFEIHGRVEKLDIIWDENDRIGTIEEVVLI